MSAALSIHTGIQKSRPEKNQVVKANFRISNECLDSLKTIKQVLGYSHKDSIEYVISTLTKELDLYSASQKSFTDQTPFACDVIRRLERGNYVPEERRTFSIEEKSLQLLQDISISLNTSKDSIVDSGIIELKLYMEGMTVHAMKRAITNLDTIESIYADLNNMEFEGLGYEYIAGKSYVHLVDEAISGTTGLWSALKKHVEGNYKKFSAIFPEEVIDIESDSRLSPSTLSMLKEIRMEVESDGQ